MQIHPIANIMPEMSGDDFQSLKEDIAQNGLLEAIWLVDHQIIDGRHRYRACQELDIPPDFREYTGDVSTAGLVRFVISLNEKRRHLSSSQKAVIALEVERLIGGEERRGRPSKENCDNIITISQDESKSRAMAARTVGTSPSYVSDAKRIERHTPDLIEPIRQGTITIPEAKQIAELEKERRFQALERIQAGQKTKAVVKDIQREQRFNERERVARDIVDPIESQALQVKEGQIYQLGNHLLYCGNTSFSGGKFHTLLTQYEIAFAFADPPYNAGVAQWDTDFEWAHDYLSDCASIVAVTPGIASIPDFLQASDMPYRWSMACEITNGMTRGALGFGNWIYIALFSQLQSIHRNAQDIIRATIRNNETDETNHKGRKPSDLLVHLIGLFSQEQEWITDPFLGSGTTLLVAEKMNRNCIGGEINLDFCADIITRWETMTGQKAVRYDEQNAVLE